MAEAQAACTARASAVLQAQKHLMQYVRVSPDCSALRDVPLVDQYELLLHGAFGAQA